jgi:phosphatidylserine/phosphatidylglycerophosphate/cardiolipin synthase-like enzyme
MSLRKFRVEVAHRNTSDTQTIEQLAETHSAAQLLDRTRKREFANQKEKDAALEEVSAAVRARIEQLSQTDEDERVINLLLKLIEEKRFVIKVYTKSRLHAKAYIFDYPTERYDRGMAIIGSSNLSLSGLVDNTELNVEVHGKGNHEQLTKWFNDLWGEAEDFDAELMRELRSSWALNAITPFELMSKSCSSSSVIVWNIRSKQCRATFRRSPIFNGRRFNRRCGF